MADKSFKVKSGLNIPITSAAILTTDSSGNISSTNVLPISAGGTGQTSATNAINALLPVQNGGTVNYAIQSDGSNVNWGKLYNQTIKNNGTTVNPRGIVNVVGATFTDDSSTDTTTITFTDTTGVSTSGGSTITTSSASTKGLVIQGAASQTANLQEWQRSNGSTDLRVTNFGALISGGGTTIASNPTINAYGAAMKIASGVNNYPMLIIQGATSQTANLQEWQNSSGTTLAKIDYAGKIIGTSDFWLSGGVGYFNAAGDTNGTFISVATGRGNFVLQNASAVGLTVKGAASQTANLQEWQNSAGSVQASMSPFGQIRLNSVYNISSFNNAQVNMLTTGTQITSNVAANVILSVKGAASQTANLQEWQNNSGTVLAKVDASGNVFAPTLQSTTASKATLTTNGDTGGLLISTVEDANKGLVIKRTNSTQSANLFEVQNESGAYLFRVNQAGNTTLVGNFTSANSAFFTVNATTKIPISIYAIANQTADLTQWQNSAGTVLAKVDSTGAMFTTTATAGTNTTQVATTEFVKTAIDNLIASAPGTLDTLDEIAQALNDDPNFYTTITTLTNALAEQDSYTLMGVF